MKKLVATSLFIFWTFVVSVIVASLVYYEGGRQPQVPMPNGSDQKYNTSLDGSGDSGILLSAEETAKHGSQDDCWLIIGGKVYDVTSFISLHPGGAGEIIFYCGKEATNAFNTKNQGSPHSSNAQAMLGDYYIGDLNQKVAK